MMTIIQAFWALLATRFGQIALAATLAFAGGVSLAARHYHAREARLAAQHAAAVAREHDRREAVIREAQAEAEAASQAIAAITADNGRLEQEIARASAKNDRRACLPADAVLRLNRIGQTGRGTR